VRYSGNPDDLGHVRMTGIGFWQRGQQVICGMSWYDIALPTRCGRFWLRQAAIVAVKRPHRSAKSIPGSRLLSCGPTDLVRAEPRAPGVASRPGVTCLSMNRLAPAQRCVGIVSPVEHIVGDLLGHIPGPPFDGVEGDHPQRVPVLPRDHIVDDRIAIGFCEVRLSKRAAQVAEVLNDDVRR
jgi:hypothetical protein